MSRKLLHNLGSLIGPVLFIIASIILYHTLGKYHYQDIVQQLKAIPLRSLLLGVMLTFFSYSAMTFYDYLALLYIQHPLRYSRIALASFIGDAFAHNVTLLGGSAARYRIYSALGVSAYETAKLVIFCVLTFWLGFFVVGGSAFVLEPMAIPPALHVPFGTIRPLGFIFLAFVAAYLIFAAFRKEPVKLRDWQIPLPSLSLSIGQIAISSLDWVLAASVLYSLLPFAADLSYPKFLVFFLFAQSIGLLSSVPSGLGVFDTTIILFMSPYCSPSAVIGSLIFYRGIYYLLPLVAASGLLATYEILKKRHLFQQFVTTLGRWSSVIMPHVFAFIAFVGGAVLLFSGAMPVAKGRLAWLADFLPLPVIEISHFLGSLAGAGLLIIARGLQRRLDAAYHFAVVFFGAGIVFSLLKGLDYEEAIVLSIMLFALLPCRREFYRKASVISQSFTPLWAAFIAIVLFCSVWLGFFSYKHLEYSNELWWRFTLYGNAPRFLRAATGTIIIVLFYGIIRLLRPAVPKPVAGSTADMTAAETIIKDSRETYANLALLEDKTFIFSENKSTFIMYGVEGRSWIVLGNPVGPEKEWEELIWQFRELSDQYDGWTVFYEVENKYPDLYLDLGLTFLKLGEEANVALEDFSVEGNVHKWLRYVLNKFEKENYTFEIIPAEVVPELLAEFRQISDAWLEEKNTREKGFSLGFFNEEYLKHFPAAVVRSADRIIAFASIWAGAEKEELSIDLMRYLPDSPNGVMDYLFTQLMLWGKREGYRHFNLGMAPLSGFEDRVLAPLWQRLGGFVFRHGEHFYNFQGLRQYKEKFLPQWQPKYLVCPGGLVLPRVLVNVASLVSSGLKGVVAK